MANAADLWGRQFKLRRSALRLHLRSERDDAVAARDRPFDAHFEDRATFVVRERIRIEQIAFV
jgi:hypothetical protein